MSQQESILKDLKVGDLVYHALYGKKWIGVIVAFKDIEHVKSEPKEKALVRIQPGTKFENFFKDSTISTYKINDNLGYISSHWLFKLEKKEKWRH
ncbi:MAG TPA: hypothetical protein DCM40_18160 [Maribacter sp.]|nr:hypothetical protein [Maribacter sp.]|tara:strand:+ start:254 stop:538 length:285 start_codon:yes stop_codon:yes gene_type:complete